MQALEERYVDVGVGVTNAQFLSFTLGGEVYAVDILRVQEIRGWEPVRPLPDVPPHVKGVLDLRGTIVPVLDLRVRFGSTQPDYRSTTVVIVVNVRDGQGGARIVGCVVDAVSDVLDLAGKDIRPPPPLGGCIGNRYLRGMVTLDRRMVILLDVDKLFDDRDLQLAGAAGD